MALLPEAVDAEASPRSSDRHPAARQLETERERRLHMEESLRERVIGQDHALELISESVRLPKRETQSITSSTFASPESS